jgi:hypothetical protein
MQFSHTRILAIPPLSLPPPPAPFNLPPNNCSKAEVINLLETAGFSRANPYYVVQQGRITAMAAMRDAERLELLKEIGGCGGGGVGSGL